MRLLALMLLALAMTGCAQTDYQDLKDFVAEVKARPPGGISPAPQPAEVETFLYVAGDRRDPFTAQSDMADETAEVVESGLMPDLNRRREELENYSLDTLRMVGTLEQDAQTWGLVKTNDGTIHRVAEGNYMGRNHGRIVVIGEEKIKLLELVKVGSSYREQEAALGLGGSE